MSRKPEIIEITGHTRIVGVIGYPIHHTLSPLMHNRAFRAIGLDYVYLPFEVEPGNLKTAINSLSALGIAGINVTIPHKENVIPFLNSLSLEARLIGSVNTIEVKKEGLTGYNTDAFGFLESLKRNSVTPEKKNIFLAGAGGAGRAIAFQSFLSGASSLTIRDIDSERARKLKSSLEEAFPSAKTESLSASGEDEQKFKAALSEADICVNATPQGMKPGDSPAFDVRLCKKGAFIFDLVYNPPKTPLTEAASKAGLKSVNGLEMLAFQGAKAFQIWTGVESSPSDIMLSALKEKFGG